MDGDETLGRPDGGAEDVDTSGGQLIIRGGTIITAEREFVGDIVVRDGRIAAIIDAAERTQRERDGRKLDHRPARGHGIDPDREAKRDPGGAHGYDNVPVIDAQGMYVLPGLIDVHVHLRDPGATHKENFSTGTAAAALGGVTTVLDMPNTIPPVSSAHILHEKAAAVAGRAYVDYGLYGVINEDNLSELAGLAEAGAVALKLFLGPTTGDIRAPGWGRLIEVFETVRDLGLPLVVHAEDRDVIEYWERRQAVERRVGQPEERRAVDRGVGEHEERRAVDRGVGEYEERRAVDRGVGQHEERHAVDGSISEHAGRRPVEPAATQHREQRAADRDYAAFLATRPRFGEAAATQTVCLLAAMTNTPVHIAHVSIAEAVAVIREAKAGGAPVSAETCPPYLTMTAADCERLGPLSKILPPIREQADQDELWRALHDGTIDIIATDHAPHESAAKDGLPWTKAAGGMVGVQTMLPVLLNEVHRGRLSFHDVVRWTSRRPAELFGLSQRKGDIRVGLDADLVIVDPRRDTTVTPDWLYSLSNNSPLLGETLHGAVVHTVVRGHVVVRDGNLMGPPVGRQL